MKPRQRLTGAARVAHERRILVAKARARLAQRDTDSVADTVTLLRLAVRS